MMWTKHKESKQPKFSLSGRYNSQLSKADVAIEYLFRFDMNHDGHVTADEIEAALKTLKQLSVSKTWSQYAAKQDACENEKLTMLNEAQFLIDSQRFYEALLALGRGTVRPTAEALGLAYALRQDGATKTQLYHYVDACHHRETVAS